MIVDLLTGSTGFLGHHLAARLGRDGRKLRDRTSRNGSQRIPPEITDVVGATSRARDAAEGDGRHRRRVPHRGARERRRQPDAFRRDNVGAVETLLRAAEAAGVRRCFVHVSSAGIFGAGQKGAAIDESTPLDPQIESRGFYAWSKAESDTLVRAFAAQSKLETVVVRPGILYGGDAQPFLARPSSPSRAARAAASWSDRARRCCRSRTSTTPATRSRSRRSAACRAARTT